MTQDYTISFEFFPPKTPEHEAALWENVEKLSPLNPSFVSVTYGAGGSTRERTHDILRRLIKETNLNPAAHLTCVGASRDEVDAVIQSYKACGVKHIVALRGDPVGGLGTPYIAHPEGYARTSDLVAGIKAIGDFEVSVSAYPEKHPEAASLDADIDALQAKVDAGADRAITQFFFDNDVFYRYLDKVHARGITIPILPGILPIQNFKQVAKFAERCGTNIPNRSRQIFERAEGDKNAQHEVAIQECCRQISCLKANGINHFHFYTMNKAALVIQSCLQEQLCPEFSVAAE